MAVLVTNHKARRDFFILETHEAGIELTGTEVKSLRANRASIDDAFARVEHGQVWLYNAHIAQYQQGSIHNHEPKRPRRLLLHKKQIHRIFSKASIKGHALIPLRMYFHGRWAKVELAVAKSKRRADKREELRRKAVERDVAQALNKTKRLQK